MTNREDELLANIGQPAGPQGSNEYVCEQANQQQLNNHQDGTQLSEFYSENPPSSVSSGFSDDDSLSGAEGDPKTIEQIVDMVRSRGRQGLVQEYAEIRARAPEGTFTKTKVIHFRSRKVVMEEECLNGQTVEVVSVYKYLGLLIDENLSWGAHITNRSATS